MPVAMVTGASRGIGRAIAVALAGSGFTVAGVARSRGDLDETCGLVAALGATALGVTADVTDPQAVHDAVREIEARAGAISLLVNNAGTLSAIGPLWEVDPDAWWSDVQTSLAGTFNCCREVVPGMAERGEGRIVNLTSYVAVRPSPYLCGYAAGKAGVNSLTEALAASLAGHGVSVFAVAPGFTDSVMTAQILESPAGRRWLPDAGSGGRVPPERSAELVTWLASGAGDELNGRLIHALDDRDELLRRIEEIRAADLYAPRLRRLGS